jgi:hypothetical protein
MLFYISETMPGIWGFLSRNLNIQYSTRNIQPKKGHANQRRQKRIPVKNAKHCDDTTPWKLEIPCWLLDIPLFSVLRHFLTGKSIQPPLGLEGLIDD